MPRGRANPTPSRLPGLGEQLDVTDSNDADVHVIRRRSGDVAVHTAGHVIELDPVTASTVGAFMSGHFRLSPETAERLGAVLGGLTIDWVRLDPADGAVGHTIQELGVRQRTGVTIVAILRGSIPIVAPDPDVRLEGRDELVVACREQDLDRFVRFLAEGA